MIKLGRKQTGAALLSVLIMGTVSIVFLVALASIVTSATRVSSQNKWAAAVRNCAEIGIDYAVDQFNSVYPCTLDASSGSSKLTALPDNQLSAAQVDGVTPNTGIPNVKVTIKVTRLSMDSWKELSKFSSIYSGQLDPNNGPDKVEKKLTDPISTNMTEASGGGFRVVESTATNGVVSKTIRVILKARFDPQPISGDPLVPNGSGSGAYFQNPLFANSNLTLGNNITIQQEQTDPNGPRSTIHSSANGEYAVFNLNVSTNQIASLGSNSKIWGDVTVRGANPGSTPLVTAPTDATIEGRALTTGDVGETVKSYEDSGNVRARADTPTGSEGARFGDNIDKAISTPISSAQSQMAPVPAPTDAASLGALSSYAASKTSPSGNAFETASLNTNGVPQGESVKFDVTSPVDIYVNQGSSSTNAIDIDTSRVSTTSPTSPSSNFRIWYEGNRPVNLELSADFRGMIYAPNAPITITGGKNTTGTFSGALVGKTVTVNPSATTPLPLTMNINTDFSPSSTSGGGGGSSKGLTYNIRPEEGSLIQGWQPISWQELP